MGELSLWLARKGWWVRSALVSFLAVTLTAAIIGGAFFNHHDKRLLWLLVAPAAFAGYLLYLCWKQPTPAAADLWAPVAVAPCEPVQAEPPALLYRAPAGITIEFHWLGGGVADPQENVPLSILGLGERPAPGTVIRYSGKRWRVEESALTLSEHPQLPLAQAYALFELPE
jgi:hypothetical protein